MSQPPPLTAREAAALVGKSKSQINRDASEGRVPIAEQYPGYNGARLFERDAVLSAYGIVEQPA